MSSTSLVCICCLFWPNKHVLLISFDTRRSQMRSVPLQHCTPLSSHHLFLPHRFFLSLLRRLQICRGGACPADLGGTRGGKPQKRQQLLFHDPVLQQPHSPADEWEGRPWEGDGGGQGEVQKRPWWDCNTMCSVSLQMFASVSKP